MDQIIKHLLHRSGGLGRINFIERAHRYSKLDVRNSGKDHSKCGEGLLQRLVDMMWMSKRSGRLRPTNVVQQVVLNGATTSTGPVAVADSLNENEGSGDNTQGESEDFHQSMETEDIDQETKAEEPGTVQALLQDVTIEEIKVKEENSDDAEAMDREEEETAAADGDRELADDDSISEDAIMCAQVKVEKEEVEEQEQDQTEEEQNSNSESEPVLINGSRNGDNVDNVGATAADSSPRSPESTSQIHDFISASDGLEIAVELEGHIGRLGNLLALKETEWSAILKLKKHLEYVLDQVRCTQRIGKVHENMIGPMSVNDVKACMKLMVSEKALFNQAERQIEESIESAETENESLQGIFPYKSQSVGREESTSLQRSDSFTATAALQKLCERKRKAADEPLSRRATKQKMMELPSKVIGTGRKGTIIDVQSIIQSHRNLSGPKSSNSAKAASAYVTHINMSPERQYLKTLKDLFTLIDVDKPQEPISTPVPIVPTTTVSQINKIIPKQNKNGRPIRQPANNSLLSNPVPSGSGTLAKMLSPSTHSSIGGNRGSGDLSTSQKFVSKHSNADANLSLANLLATSKVETKLNISKVKKEQETAPVCQGCNLSRAQFVCAGCANQWYCSRECQVAAWDEHSEICSG